jgi:hypothetical protein
MEVVNCYDCRREIVFLNGLPGGAQIGVCAACGDKRRRRASAQPDFTGFSRESLQLSIDGKPAAISTTMKVN